MKTYSIKESAEYLDRDNNSINQYRQRKRFPEPYSHEMRRGKMTAVWTAEQLKSWNPNNYLK